MFGTWRTFLALEVVVSHILFVPILGAYAVFSFFVLSGYLMTSIMHETYGYSVAGLRRYAQNRALRLYPNYWFALVVSLIVISFAGQVEAARHFASFVIPQSLFAWVQNLAMIFPYVVPSEAPAILVPPSWALTVEIVYYALIGFGVSRTKTTTLWWLAVSVAYVVIVSIVTTGNRYAYAAIPAASLPFSVGSLAWHYRADMRRRFAPLGAKGLATLIMARWAIVIVALVALWQFDWAEATMIALWINTALCAIVITLLSTVDVPARLHRHDKAIGNFSYPIYLMHMQMGVLISVLLFGTQMPRARSIEGVLVLMLTLLLTWLLGVFCIRILDPAIERRRARIRQQAIAGAAV